MRRRLGRRQFLRLSATAALGAGAAACASAPQVTQRVVKETAAIEIGAGGGTMKFTTFTNAGLGISSVVPAGWVEKSAGEFHRGDGSPKQYRPEAIHVYRQPGRYTVTLTVTTGTRYSYKSTEVRIHEP